MSMLRCPTFGFHLCGLREVVQVRLELPEIPVAHDTASNQRFGPTSA